jgi:hypothetical protein
VRLFLRVSRDISELHQIKILEGQTLQGGQGRHGFAIFQNMIMRLIALSLVSLFAGISLANAEACFSQEGLFMTGPLAAGRTVTGGFNFDPQIFSRFATFLDTTSDKEIEDLLKRSGDQLSGHLQFGYLLKQVLRDRYVFEVFKDFMGTGGKFLPIRGGGRYWAIPEAGQKNQNIMVGLASHQGESNSNLEIKKTMVHELLHYVFDKMDLDISETSLKGAPDHELIETIEERFIIVSLIEAKKSLLDEELDGFWTYRKIINPVYNDFLKDYVTAMTQNLQSQENISRGSATRLGNSYLFSPAQMQDLRELWTMNGELIQKAQEIAMQFNPKKPHKAFDKKEAREAFFNFLNERLQPLHPCLSLTSLEF